MTTNDTAPVIYGDYLQAATSTETTKYISEMISKKKSTNKLTFMDVLVDNKKSTDRLKEKRAKSTRELINNDLIDEPGDRKLTTRQELIEDAYDLEADKHKFLKRHAKKKVNLLSRNQFNQV